MAAGLQAALALVGRELVRLARQPSRVVATIGTPLLAWVFLSAGFAGSFTGVVDGGARATGGVSYGAFALPGVAMMVVVFSSVFAALSLIQDRQGGFLQAALVSAAPRWAVTGSKVVASVLVAGAQALLVVGLGALSVGATPGVLGAVAGAGALACAAIGVTSLSLAAAWKINSVSGFHGVMNLALMPMWFLSGALFPAEGASPWIRWAILANPLHWCTRWLGHGLGVWTGELGWAWAGSIVFAAGGVTLAWWTVGRLPGPQGSTTPR